MSVFFGSVDPYSMLFPFAVVSVPVIGFVGRLIWRASMRRGLWILITTVFLSAVIGWWRGPVWIWAVVFGAVLVSLFVEPDPPRHNSWWVRHEEARAAGRRDVAYYIIPALIGLGSVAPLLLLVVAAAQPEETFPRATVEGVIQLTPEEPIAVVDIEVTLEGGVAGETAQLGIQKSIPFSGTSGLRRGLARTLVFPVEDGTVTDAARIGSVYSTHFVDLDNTCTDCSYRYRVVYSLDPRSFEQPSDIKYEATFSWGDDYGPPDVGAGELPEAIVTATPADVSSYRITSNLVTDDTQWTAERPFDLRMVTVDIDPALVPASGLAAWPALERRAASIIRDPGQGDPRALVISDIKELDPACESAACLQYSYVASILDVQASLPAESLGFEVMHWIDYFDRTDTGAGSLRISSTAPGAWLEERNSGELQLESTDDHIVTIDFDVGRAAAAGIGSGIARLTVSAPPGVDIKSVSPYPAQGSRPFSLNSCELRPPCSVSLIVKGKPGDRVTWNLDVAYGFFNVSDTPTGADITFTPPEVKTRK